MNILTSRSLHLTERGHGTNWAEGCMGPTVNVDVVAYRGNPSFCRESKHGRPSRSPVTIQTYSGTTGKGDVGQVSYSVAKGVKRRPSRRLSSDPTSSGVSAASAILCMALTLLSINLLSTASDCSCHMYGA
jgi:hypothetical protein